MFSGIIEAKSKVLSAQRRSGSVVIEVEKPKEFDDLAEGQSIANDGVCLTIEVFDSKSMRFALAAETLHITGWNPELLTGYEMNLERSIRFGDRVHGHFVTGHVDARVLVDEISDEGESRWIWVRFPERLAPMIWKKGSVALNGVSLTINDVQDLRFSVCLIRETLNRTNLSKLKPGDPINLEVDTMARAINRQFEVWTQGGEALKQWLNAQGVKL